MIYGLYNKNTGYVRYVGRTKQPLKIRLSGHISHSKRRNDPKSEWIQEIGKESVGIKLLDKFSENESEAELWWMDYLEFLGCDLLNRNRYEAGGYVGQHGNFEITDEVKKLMGSVPDGEVAERFDVHITTVVKHRNRLGIDPYVPQKGNQRQLPKECIEKLGEVSDNKLADEFDVTRKTLQRRREEMGIDAYEKKKSATSKECVKLLGTMPDAELAERFNVSKSTIHRRRKARGIPSYRSQK